MKITLTILCLLVYPVFCLPASSLASAAQPEAEPDGQEMTLPRVVDYALEHSPDIQTASVEIKRREGIAKTARSFLFPQVAVVGDISHWRLDHVYPPGTLTHFDDTVYSVGAEMRLLVWDFGRTASDLEAARERIAVAQASLDRRTQQIIFNVASLFLQTLTHLDLMDAAQSTRKSLEVLLHQTKELVEAGRDARTDALKISTRLAQVESDIPALDAGRRTSLSSLAAAMGLAGELPRLVYTQPENALRPMSYGSEAELIEEAMGKRPDLHAQSHEVKARSSLERATRLSRGPRSEFRASAYKYASNSPGMTGLADGVSGNDVGDWSVGLRITFPLFDAGLRSGQIRSAEAQQRYRAGCRRKAQTGNRARG